MNLHRTGLSSCNGRKGPVGFHQSSASCENFWTSADSACLPHRLAQLGFWDSKRTLAGLAKLESVAALQVLDLALPRRSQS